MAVAVFDADVLIAFLSSADAQHAEAVERIRRALEPGTQRLVSAVNYAELLVGPLRARGLAGVEVVDSMFERLGIETVPVDGAMARQAAAVRARTALKAQDAFALATAVLAERSGHVDVRVESCDRKVVEAYSALHPLPPEQP